MNHQQDTERQNHSNEVKLDGVFRKSTASSVDCVEVAKRSDGTVQVRHSKDRKEYTLSFSRSEWIAFLQGVYNGEFDV